MERSNDQTTRFNGGDMGYFTLDILPATYKSALEHAQKGQLVGPIAVQGGFAILRIEDRRPETPTTLEESRSQILNYLKYDQIRILLDHLRHGTKVKMLIDDRGLAGEGNQEPASASKDALEQMSKESDDSEKPVTEGASSASESAKPASNTSASADTAASREAEAEAGRLLARQRVHHFAPPADAHKGNH